MDIAINVVGTSPLLMHNPRMVDPNFAITREIKALTGKRKKTEDDLKAIERLEWYGGLYEQNGVVVQPASKLRKCLINTAKIMKLGKGIERTLSFSELHVPLEYDGPVDIDELYESGNYHSRLSVGVSGKRVMRMRPQFFPWSMRVSGVFVTDAGVQVEELRRIVELAGTIEGIGDNRVNGYGRFMGELEVTK